MKRDIEIRTEDGIAKAGLFQADGGGAAKAGVILYMDAFGPRPALDGWPSDWRARATRCWCPISSIATAPYGPFDAKTAFADDKIARRADGAGRRHHAGDDPPRHRGLSRCARRRTALPARSARSAIAWAAAAPSMRRPAYPDRIVAAASIHGGNLASDSPDSPHANAASIKARVYVGTAGVDRSFPPEQSARLAEALRTAEIDHIIENYVGMQHGWAVSDHSVYDEAGAERHWKRLTDFFAETLG